MPTFTYSFTKKKIFSISETVSEIGRFSEEIRKKTNPKFRSFDPMFSVVDINNSGLVNNKLIKHSFHKGSIFEKFSNDDGLIINVDIDKILSPQIHYLGKKFRIKYRKDRVFEGLVTNIDNKTIKVKYKFFCKKLNSNIFWNRKK